MIFSPFANFDDHPLSQTPFVCLWANLWRGVPAKLFSVQTGQKFLFGLSLTDSPLFVNTHIHKVVLHDMHCSTICMYAMQRLYSKSSALLDNRTTISIQFCPQATEVPLSPARPLRPWTSECISLAAPLINLPKKWLRIFRPYVPIYDHTFRRLCRLNVREKGPTGAITPPIAEI